MKVSLTLAAAACLLVFTTPSQASPTATADSRPTTALTVSGNVCAGTSHRTRDLQGGWKQGCATGYTSREARGRQACTGQYLNDNALTVAVSPRWRSIRCGARIKICYRKCVIARRADTGPCWSPCTHWNHLNRDFDMTRATARAIGRHGAGWYYPGLVRWRVVSQP